MNNPAALNVEKELSWFFSELNRRGLPFCVLRNYEDLPYTVENDLDLLIDPERIEAYEEVLKNLGERFQWKRFWNTTHFNVNSHALFSIKGKELRMFYIDFLFGISLIRSSHLQSKTPYGERPLMERIPYRNLFILSPEWEATHLILHVFFDSTSDQRGTFLRYLPKMRKGEYVDIKKKLGEVLGSRTANKILAALEDKPEESLQDLRSWAWRRVRFKPILIKGFATHLFQRGREWFKNVFNPPGFLVILKNGDTGISGELMERIAKVWGRTHEMTVIRSTDNQKTGGRVVFEMFKAYFSKILPDMLRGRVILVHHHMFNSVLPGETTRFDWRKYVGKSMFFLNGSSGVVFKVCGAGKEGPDKSGDRKTFPVQILHLHGDNEQKAHTVIGRIVQLMENRLRLTEA